MLDSNIYIFRPGFTLPTYNPSVRSAPQVSWCQNVYLAKSVIPYLERCSEKSTSSKRCRFHTYLHAVSERLTLIYWRWLLSSIVWSGQITKEMSLRHSKHCWRMKNLLMWVSYPLYPTGSPLEDPGLLGYISVPFLPKIGSHLKCFLKILESPF